MHYKMQYHQIRDNPNSAVLSFLSGLTSSPDKFDSVLRTWPSHDTTRCVTQKQYYKGVVIPRSC